MKLFEIVYEVIHRNGNTFKIRTEGYNIKINDQEFSFERYDTGTLQRYKLTDIPETQKALEVINIRIKEII